MKRLALLGLLSFSLSATAAPLQVKIEGFNFSYTNPKGQGTAAGFYRNMRSADGAVTVEVEKKAEGLLVNVAGGENHQFELKQAPAFVMDAETMTIDNMNLDFSHTLSLSLGFGEFNSKKDELRLDGFRLDCDRELSEKELTDDVLIGCIRRLRLQSSKFSSQEVSSILQKLIPVRGDLRIKELDLQSNNGGYKLSADIKADVSGKLKSSGTVSFDKATRVVTIKVSEVKLGILSVRGMVFDELKKKASESLVVKEPYVHIKLK